MKLDLLKMCRLRNTITSNHSSKKPCLSILRIWLMLFCLFSVYQSKSQCHINDWTALKGFYENINGDNWRYKTGWAEVKGSQPTPNCNLDLLYGIRLDSVGRVDRLEMAKNNLEGILSPELGKLSNLKILRLNDYSIGGNIPPEIGNLSKLESFSLSYCRGISGSIPPELGKLSRLKSLTVEYGELTGSIPAELGNLSNLYFLNLKNNLLSGSIPPELGNLINVKLIDLYNNELSGSIPAELGNLSNLTFLSLTQNQVSGNIPPELGNLKELQLLALGSNNLSGSIPLELGYLSNVATLTFSQNNLNGCFPNSFKSICEQLSNGNNSNLYISDGNNFDASWSEFCANGIGACTTGNNNDGGCTDVNAINYNSNATVDDGSCQYEDTNAQVFSTFHWLNTLVNQDNCNGESITVYDTGYYNFILIQNGNEGKLYFENGTFYCNETPTYSCVAAYGLNNVAQTWACSNNTSVSGCTDERAINYNSDATLDDGSCQYDNNNTPVFSNFPWLSTYVNQGNCNGESITVYDTGFYNFILIQNGNEGKLYFENGTYYCDETPTYSCVAAYGLNNVAQTWTCSNNTSVSGCTDANAINYNSDATLDDGSCEYDNNNAQVFSTFPWLSTYVNQGNCNGESITVYDTGYYNFILIKNGNEGKLYFENGTYYCDETPSYSCVAAYGFTNIVNSWACGGFNNHKQVQSNTNDISKITPFNIYPNPATNIVFIDLLDEATYQINLIDISGKMMKQIETEPDATTVEINVSDLPKGIYLVELKNQGVAHTKKLVID